MTTRLLVIQNLSRPSVEVQRNETRGRMRKWIAGDLEGWG